MRPSPHPARAGHGWYKEMMRTEVTTQIAAPAERVWAILSDVERWPTWTASVTSVALDGPLAGDATAKIRQPKLPVTTWTVTELVPGRSFTWQAVAPGSRATGWHEVTPTGDGSCEVRLAIEQAGPLGTVVGWLYRGLTKRYVAMEAAGLAKQATAPPSP
ncbi:MAG: SRPBCC family protein [Acidimicrobiales bacterium]